MKCYLIIIIRYCLLCHNHIDLCINISQCIRHYTKCQPYTKINDDMTIELPHQVYINVQDGIYGHKSSLTFFSSMLYLINVFLRIDCFFVAVCICSLPTLWWVCMTRWWWTQKAQGSVGWSGYLNTSWTPAASPSSSPRGPIQLQRRYNYHPNSWLYFYHTIILPKWILLQEASEFLMLDASLWLKKKLILLHYKIHRPLQAISFPVA
jgi:hypothetical protein